VLESITEAEVVVFAPCNPLVSLGTILALPGVRAALQATRARRVAISPIVGGGTIKGPADRMMRGLGWEVSAFGVANAYRDILDVMVIDEADVDLAERIRGLGLEVLVTDTIMRDVEAKRRLAAATLQSARERAR
jgi:LPPG:FO 2-phospho-L-lactate transferase